MPHVELVIEDQAAHIQLTRPDKLNAVGQQMADELIAAVGTIERREDTRVVTLTGRGRAFCAGAELGRQDLEAAGAQRHWIETVAQTLDWIQNIRCPVIAGVHGYALGLGCSLAMAADLVIVAEDAVLGFPEVRHGLVPGVTMAQLMRIADRRVISELVLLAQTFSGVEAKDYGLVNRVVPGDALQTELEGLAQKVTELSPAALRLSKQLLNELDGLPPSERSEAGVAAVLLGRDTDDAREGARSFREKSRPEWPGT